MYGSRESEFKNGKKTRIVKFSACESNTCTCKSYRVDDRSLSELEAEHGLEHGCHVGGIGSNVDIMHEEENLEDDDLSVNKKPV